MGNAEYMGILTRVITMFRTSLLLALAACVSAEPGVYPLAYGGYGSYSLGTGVGIAGYAPAAVPGLLGGYAGSGRYVANSGGVVHIAKREAVAEPGYGYGLYGGYGIGGFGTGVGIAGYAPAAVPGVYGGYAGAGRYVANSAGVVHVAKREAEAEPGYGLGHYGYGGYGFGYAGHLGYGYGGHYYGKREAEAEPGYLGYGYGGYGLGYAGHIGYGGYGLGYGRGYYYG